MIQPRPTITEKTAAIAWAHAWNTHDLSLLAPLVHENLRVLDQRRWDPTIGGPHFLSMLADYFACVPLAKISTRMELATLPRSTGDHRPLRPCVIEYRFDRPTSTILFRVHAGTIRLIERRLLPPPTDCVLSGVCPGLDSDPLEVVN